MLSDVIPHPFTLLSRRHPPLKTDQQLKENPLAEVFDQGGATTFVYFEHILLQSIGERCVCVWRMSGYIFVC